MISVTMTIGSLCCSPSLSASIQQRDEYSNVLGEELPLTDGIIFDLSSLYHPVQRPVDRRLQWRKVYASKGDQGPKSRVPGLMEHNITLFDLNKILTTASSAPATGSSQGGWNWKLRLIQNQYWLKLKIETDWSSILAMFNLRGGCGAIPTLSLVDEEHKRGFRRGHARDQHDHHQDLRHPHPSIFPGIVLSDSQLFLLSGHILFQEPLKQICC